MIWVTTFQLLNCNMNKSTIITLVILGLGPIALGLLLMATGTPAGGVGFFIFLPWTLIWSIIGVCYLISLLFKLSRSKESDYNSSIEKDKTKDTKCREHTADEISKKEIKKRNARRRYAYLSFILLGLISLWGSYLTYGAVEGVGGYTPGFLGVMDFFLSNPLAIPISIAAISGPFLSLFTNWDDGYLMSMAGLSFLLVVLAGIVSVTALSWIFLAYGVACLVICITKGSYNK
jgi:hypothetical protein